MVKIWMRTAMSQSDTVCMLPDILKNQCRLSTSVADNRRAQANARFRTRRIKTISYQDSTSEIDFYGKFRPGHFVQ